MNSGAPGEHPTNLTGSLRSSVRWNTLSLSGRQGIRAVTSLLLAGILGQDNYGIIGLATVYVGFVILFVQFGFGTALVQRPELKAGHIGAATRLSIGSGALFAALTLLLAPVIADFFDTPELTSLLRVLSILVVIKALAIVPSSLLMREMRFGPLATAELIGAVLGASAGIIVAITTESYWAIVWQFLITDSIILLGVIWAQPAMKWRTTRSELGDLVGFGTKLLGTNIVNFASSNGDNVVVGRFEGNVALADYTLSFRVLSLPLQIVGQTVARTLLPIFSRLQHDVNAVADLYYRSQRAITAVVAGPLVVIALAAPDGIALVLGDEWTSAATAMRWIAMAAILQLGFGNTGMTLVALGRPGWQFWWSSFTTVLSLIGFAVGVRWGIEGVAASRVVIGVPTVLLAVGVVGRLVPVSPWRSLTLLAPVVAACLVVAGTWFVLEPLTDGLARLPRLVVRCGITGSIYLALTAAIAPIRHDVLRLVKTGPQGSSTDAEGQGEEGS